MKHNHSRLVTAFYDTPWAIIPSRLAAMRNVLNRWAAGFRLTDTEIKAAIGDTQSAHDARRGQVGPRAVGVIQVFGVLAQRSHVNEASESFQGADAIGHTFDQMMANDEVGAIALEIDSPGGSVYGIQELYNKISAARGQKKVVAIANSMAASAAYWIASAAEEVVVTPGGEVGSIGVLMAHEDWSKALADQGVETTIISAGKYKTEGNPFEPLSDDAREAFQANVDTYYATFVDSVAAGRGVKASEVRGGFGEGRVLTAKDAVAEGLADRVDTFEATISRLTKTKRAQTPVRDAAKHRLDLSAVE